MDEPKDDFDPAHGPEKVKFLPGSSSAFGSSTGENAARTRPRLGGTQWVSEKVKLKSGDLLIVERSTRARNAGVRGGVESADEATVTNLHTPTMSAVMLFRQSSITSTSGGRTSSSPAWPAR